MTELTKLTNKQRELYTCDSKLVIADGIVGAGKSKAGIYKLANETQHYYHNHEVALAFKSVKQYHSIGETELRAWCREVGATIRNAPNAHYITTTNGHTNKYTRVLGRDVSSAESVQGLNLCGAFVDEGPNMPQDFLYQLRMRLRVPGYRLTMACNPSGPKHTCLLYTSPSPRDS